MLYIQKKKGENNNRFERRKERGLKKEMRSKEESGVKQTVNILSKEARYSQRKELLCVQ